MGVFLQLEETQSKQFPMVWCKNCRAVSLSGKRICDSPSIRVSEISVYYENRRVVPTLGKHLFTLHFAKA